MALLIAQSREVSAGPAITEDNPPNFLSLGDSLIWGQGLRPQNRYREIVRRRIEEDHGRVTELSMARSGAWLKCAPAIEECRVDNEYYTGEIMSGNDPPPYYSFSGFAREMPNMTLTIQHQVKVAHDIINRQWGKAAVEGVRWILLNGGINDVGINNILVPVRAETEGYTIRCWSAWLLREAERMEKLMAETLTRALRLFPAASIVVPGYFPIFSLYSVASVAELRSVGAAHAGVNVALTSMAGLDALANVSLAWQAASTNYLRSAITRVLNPAEFRSRIVLFARSNIEGSHCLFGPDPWLWGFSNLPPSFPATEAEWVQLVAGFTAEDEVAADRVRVCSANQEDYRCRIASIAHPNVEGARDYANSIIGVMEDAGLLRARGDRCLAAARRRKTLCRIMRDEGNYRCLQLDGQGCTACADTTNQGARLARGLLERGAADVRAGAGNFVAAGACFDNTVGNIAQVAGGQFVAAAGNFSQSANHLLAVANCWNNTQAALQACDDATANRIAGCNREYNQRVNNNCNFQCNSFTNCNQFGVFNPLRYACRTARAVCVAAAEGARVVCIAGAATLLGACILEAEGAGALCKTGEVAQNTGCSISEGAQAGWEGLKGSAHVFMGIVVGLGEFGDALRCALRNTARGFGNILIGVGKVLLGSGIALAAFGFYITCTGTRWMLSRSCQAVAASISGGCRVATAVLGVPCAVRNRNSEPIRL